jgi:ribosomal-protein-alanine N-acetyltransferase
MRPIRSRRQLSTAARIDVAAFAPGWHLDETGIIDASNATPQSRVRLAVTADDEPAGYMITGRNGTAGFVQRLAVDPRLAGRGVARALLHDGIQWLGRRGVTEVLVNTDLDNRRALDLYRRHGFAELPERLSVLAVPLEGDGSRRRDPSESDR